MFPWRIYNNFFDHSHLVLLRLESTPRGLAQEIYKFRDEFIPHYWNVGWNVEDYQNMMYPTPGEKEELRKTEKQQSAFEESDKLIDLLERWEEPDRARQERASTLKSEISQHALSKTSNKIACKFSLEKEHLHKRRATISPCFHLYAKKISIFNHLWTFRYPRFLH